MAVAIIGGGAAGLFAANLLEKKGIEYTVFEKQQRVGKKLLATGNGRCNLSNINISPDRYHGDRAFAAEVISAFDLQALEDILRGLGVLTVSEGDKIFPHSLQASAVLDMLRLPLKNIKTETEVLEILPQKKGYLLKTNNGTEFFETVFVSTGGKAAKKLSGGGSYSLLTDLGYKLTDLKPSIVQLKCDGTRALEGIKINAEVTLEDKKEFGEVLFTSYGLSGPPILQLSRDAKGKILKIDAVPDINFSNLTELLEERRKIKGLTLENLFTGIINKKLGAQILKRAEISPLSRSVESLTQKEIKVIANEAKCLKFEISEPNGFDNAQVTAGGIDCRDFSSKTMESKKHKGLYALGEILNVDGDCGGFNLHFAFACSYLAAYNAANEINP